MNVEHEIEGPLAAAEAATVAGWDWRVLEGRYREEPPPWDFEAEVKRLLPNVRSLLDMGTGGGEFLGDLAPLPVDTWATESYRPNVPLAEARLAPLGVRVVAFDEDSQLPLPDARFDLVINRHESFSAHELRRVLRPGGLFLTQQVGGRDNLELNQALQEEVAFGYEHWSAATAAAELRAAGLELLDEREAISKGHFSDLAAVLIYLRFAPWQVEGFSPEAFRSQLVRLHQRMQAEGGLTTGIHRFLLIARRPVEASAERP